MLSLYEVSLIHQLCVLRIVCRAETAEDGRMERGQPEGVVQVALRCPLADHRGNRYREVEERDRVAFVWLLPLTRGLLSEKNGEVGGVFSLQ